MMRIRSGWISLLLVVVSLAVGLWLWPQLPPQVATHWDMAGQVNGWSPRWFAVAIWPVLIAFLAVLAWLLPMISPRQFAITPFAGVYRGLMLVLQAVVLVVGACALLAGAGHHVPVPLVAMLTVGVLFMVTGNYMGKLRKNFFIGIRTPWTLASDAVWERTHRLGGWLFMLAGLAWVVLAFTPDAGNGWLLLAPILAAAVIPCVYSYFIYRRIELRHSSEGKRT